MTGTIGAIATFAFRLARVVVLLLVVAGCGSSSPSETSGVRGRVQAGPTCPVERPDQPCPPSPVADENVVALGSGGKEMARTTTNADGRFTLTLPAGGYRLVIDVDGPFPSCPETAVDVRTGEMTDVLIDCDTGIR